MTTEDQNSLHLKYRPEKLEQYIGQDPVVTRIRGMIKSNKIPNAIMFSGPPSAGKTTLARCIATEVNGRPAKQQQDFRELNAGTQRGIDDIRELEKQSRFRAMGKRRFIVIDEVQQLLSNAPAAQALLKPLEEPSKDTTFILCTMEPGRFTTTAGRAMVKRCTQFVLEEPSSADLLKQALRIARGEKMTYALDEEKKVLKAVVRACEQDMRVLANLIQGLQQYYEGIEGKKPKLLTPEHVSEALSSTVSSEDDAAVAFMVGIYGHQYGECVRALLDVQDEFGFVKKLVWMAQFLLNVTVLKGEKHPKLAWWNTNNKKLLAQTKSMKLTLGDVAAVSAKLTRLQTQAMSFQVPATDILASESYYLINELRSK